MWVEMMQQTCTLCLLSSVQVPLGIVPCDSEMVFEENGFLFKASRNSRYHFHDLGCDDVEQGCHVNAHNVDW